MATLELDFSDLYTKTSEFLGLGSSPTGTNLTKVKDIVYRGYRRFLFPINQRNGRRHLWSFLKKSLVITTQDNKWKYALPADFSNFIGKPRFSSSDGYPAMERRSKEWILQQRVGSDTDSYPRYYAIVPLRFDKVVGTKWEMWIWPDASGAYTVTGTYIINPAKPSGDDDYFVGGVASSEAILECSLSVAEQQEDDTIGLHTQLAQGMIQDLINSDDVDVPDSIGKMLCPRYYVSEADFRWLNAIEEGDIYS